MVKNQCLLSQIVLDALPHSNWKNLNNVIVISVPYALSCKLLLSTEDVQ